MLFVIAANGDQAAPHSQAAPPCSPVAVHNSVPAGEGVLEAGETEKAKAAVREAAQAQLPP